MTWLLFKSRFTRWLDQRVVTKEINTYGLIGTTERVRAEEKIVPTLENTTDRIWFSRQTPTRCEKESHLDWWDTSLVLVPLGSHETYSVLPLTETIVELLTLKPFPFLSVRGVMWNVILILSVWLKLKSGGTVKVMNTSTVRRILYDRYEQYEGFYITFIFKISIKIFHYSVL